LISGVLPIAWTTSSLMVMFFELPVVSSAATLKEGR
jgi:hypothetical protein